MSGRRQRRNFREKLWRGETEQQASCLRDPRKHEGVDQKEGEERRQLEARSVPAAPTFELSTQTNSHTAVHASSTWWTDVSEIFFSIITLCIFFRSSVHGDILCMQSFPEERTQHNLKTRVFCDQWWAKTNKCISYVSRKCLKNLLIFEVSPQK